ncbi:MAG: type II toxin-antitoxin system Phd/YefM family antitoxin [Verrucomicrobiales bacterium]|nr:type II toxin-antitoxin system Phd/YefM family antitoxin [Verrucomicrobiales bacterium]
MIVSVHEAKTHLSRLLTRVAAGEEVIIHRHGRPAARLVSCEPEPVERQGGADRGRFSVPEDFDDEMSEVTRIFRS